MYEITILWFSSNLQHSGQHFQGFALFRVEGHGPGIPQECATLKKKNRMKLFLEDYQVLFKYNTF
jgi:hypothetical protein